MKVTLFISFSLVIALFFRHNFYQSYKVPSEGMKPTVLIGDSILANKWIYKLQEPQRGDILFFLYPKDETKIIIERLIGLPNETLEIKNNIVYINGTQLNESYVLHTPSNSKPISDRNIENFGPVKIPNKSYFILGDNRNKSWDSRNFGLVQRDKIFGKADWIVNSIDENGKEREDRNWMSIPETQY